MKQHSFGDIARIAADTWIWYCLKGHYGDVDYMPSLKKFQLIIGHDESTDIPKCPLLDNYQCKISDDLVTQNWKVYVIDLYI